MTRFSPNSSLLLVVTLDEVIRGVEQKRPEDVEDPRERSMAAAPSAMKIARMTRASAIPTSSTNCWFALRHLETAT